MCVKGTLSRFQLLLLSGSHKPNSRVFFCAVQHLRCSVVLPGLFHAWPQVSQQQGTPLLV